jgi:hypothetical protein
MAVEPLFDSLGSIAVSSHARLRRASALLSTDDKSPLEHGPMRPSIIEILDSLQDHWIVPGPNDELPLQPVTAREMTADFVGRH